MTGWSIVWLIVRLIDWLVEGRLSVAGSLYVSCMLAFLLAPRSARGLDTCKCVCVVSEARAYNEGWLCL